MLAATSSIQVTATADAQINPVREDLRVIVFNDHPVFRSSLSWKFESCPGVTVIADAPSLWETIALAETMEPDAIIADMRIGDGNSEGFESASTLANRLPGTPVIVSSDYLSRSYASRMTEAGAAAAVSKSSSTQDLIAAIRAVVAEAKASQDKTSAAA